MKSLNIKSKTYQYYLQGFKEWLETLGYSPSSVYGMPNILREYLYYLEQNNITTIKKTKRSNKIKELTKNYITYLLERKNQRREGALSLSHINGHIGVINRFIEYLRRTQNINLSIKLTKLEEDPKTNYIILSIEEIKSLYNATEETVLGMRDRAMISIYYGCGLRKSEGINLEISDILFERKLLHVRKSKNNQDRLVPITESHLQYLNQYIHNARTLLLGKESSETKLLINERGHPLGKAMVYVKLKQLAEKASINKEIGIHTLRHSIATHLLQAGIELEQISLFLGHRSLDSTQIYTHIINESNIKI